MIYGKLSLVLFIECGRKGPWNFQLRKLRVFELSIDDITNWRFDFQSVKSDLHIVNCEALGSHKTQIFIK